MDSAPEESRRACSARTRRGHPCSSPPLSTSPYCFFHDPTDIVRARRDVARGKGQKRARPAPSLPAGPSVESLAALDLSGDDALRQFRQGLLIRVLTGSTDAPSARAAIDLATAIHEATEVGENRQFFDRMAAELSRTLESDRADENADTLEPPE